MFNHDYFLNNALVGNSTSKDGLLRYFEEAKNEMFWKKIKRKRESSMEFAGEATMLYTRHIPQEYTTDQSSQGILAIRNGNFKSLLAYEIGVISFCAGLVLFEMNLQVFRIPSETRGFSSFLLL